MNKVLIFLLIFQLNFLCATEVKEITSKNGVKFWYIKDTDSLLINMIIAFKNAGAAHQPEDKAGLPVFFSSAVFCGTEKYSKSQFTEKCSNLAASISCQADQDNLYFIFSAPKLTYEEAAGLFNKSIISPSFEEKKVKIAQDMEADFLSSLAANPMEVAYYSILPSIIFKSSPYSYGIYGSAENFVKLSINDLKEYKKRFLRIDNSEICISGNLSEKEAASLVDKILFQVEKNTELKDCIEDVVPIITADVKKYYAEGPQASILFVQKAERPLSPKRCAAKIIFKILGEGGVFKGRILSELRTKKGLIYNGSIGVIDLKHASYALGYLQTDNSKIQEAIATLKSIIKNLRKNGITQEELKFARDNMKGKMLVELRTSGKLCNFYMWRKLNGLGTNALEEIMSEVDNVTLSEVNSLAKEMLNENKMTFIVVSGERE
ncbi:MAG: insulinase family protein [Holosporaceae bacterium]|nr:insulinase family protein [Holosporaceae bacterium]